MGWEKTRRREDQEEKNGKVIKTKKQLVCTMEKIAVKDGRGRMKQQGERSRTGKYRLNKKKKIRWMKCGKQIIQYVGVLFDFLGVHSKKCVYGCDACAQTLI